MNEQTANRRRVEFKLICSRCRSVFPAGYVWEGDPLEGFVDGCELCRPQLQPLCADCGNPVRWAITNHGDGRDYCWCCDECEVCQRCGLMIKEAA